jgi:hypothetical protein
MTGMTTYVATEVLNAITSKANFTNVATAYAALFTVVGSDAGTGFTEAAYTSYTRVATPGASWNAPSGASPTTIANGSSISFPVCTNAGTAVVEVEIGFGLYDAAASGNLLQWDFLGSNSWAPFTCSAVGSGNGTVFTVPGYTPVNGDLVYVNEEYGGTLPTFTQSNFTGQLVVANASGNTFTVTNAATAVWTSTTGSGMVRKMTPQSVVPGGQPIFNAGSIVLSAG